MASRSSFVLATQDATALFMNHLIKQLDLQMYLMGYLFFNNSLTILSSNPTLFIFFNFIYFIFRQGREGERERNINVWLLLTCLTGNLAHNPGVCLDWELNLRHFGGSQACIQPSEPYQPGCNYTLKYLPKWDENFNAQESLCINVNCSFICNCKTWEQPRYPSIDEWINKLWYIQTIGYYSAIKRNELSSHQNTRKNLKCILLSQRRQSGKVTYCSAPTIWQSEEGKTIETIRRSVVVWTSGEESEWKNGLLWKVTSPGDRIINRSWWITVGSHNSFI